MKIYTVLNNQGYEETFYNLNSAKKAMVEHNAKGFITKVWSNGDWEPAGEIKLKGSNKTLFQGATKQKVESY